MSASIKPTVGRIVWFFVAGAIEPLAAIIAKVWGDNCVNLAVFNGNGVPQSHTSVRLLADGEERPTVGQWAEWMPYQKGQAAKTEALEKQVAAATSVGACNYEFTGDVGLTTQQKRQVAQLLTGNVRRVVVEVQSTSDITASDCASDTPCTAVSEKSDLTFGDAIAAIKDGHRVARAGWNGKGMYLFLEQGVFDGPKLGFASTEQPHPDHPSTLDGVRLSLYTAAEAGTITRLPSICMRTATGSFLTGWLASQTDMLAEDWVILD